MEEFNEVLVVGNNKREYAVSGKRLHKVLGIETAYKDWFPRMANYGFVEGVDFEPLKNERVQIEGNCEVSREIQDHILTLTMAEHIAMMQRNEKGKAIREYFINVERDWNDPVKVMERAMAVLEQENKFLKSTLNESQLVSQKLETKIDNLRDKMRLLKNENQRNIRSAEKEKEKREKYDFFFSKRGENVALFDMKLLFIGKRLDDERLVEFLENCGYYDAKIERPTPEAVAEGIGELGFLDVARSCSDMFLTPKGQELVLKDGLDFGKSDKLWLI